MRALLDRVVLVAGLCFSLLGIFLALPFWLVMFLLRSQLLALSELPCMLPLVSPLLPFRFSLSWNFAILIMMWLAVASLVPLDWDPLCFLDLCGLFSHQIREVFHHYFLKQVFYSLTLLFSFQYSY